MEYQKIEHDVVTEEYEKTARNFFRATAPITDYFWNSRIQTFKDGNPKHQPVISPKDTNQNERLYVVTSEEFPGWIKTSDRNVLDGQGIAIAHYEDVSKYKAREDLVRCMKNPNGLFDTHFIEVPDQILLVSFNLFKFTEKGSSAKNNYSLIPGIGIAEYSKSHIKKWITNDEKPWLDLSSGIANPYKPYEEKFGLIKNNGQNMMKDTHDVPLQDISWPVVLYDPDKGVKDPFSWSSIKDRYELPGELPKTISWHTSDIKNVIEKWLKPFANGIREVPQNKL